MIFKISIGRFSLGISTLIKGKNKIYGYTNRCDDGKFIVFMDYDEIDLDWLESELKALQQDYNLGNFYILKSSNDSYHAVCFSKVTRMELMSILQNSSIDENYYKIPFTIGKKLLTLRLTDKHNNKIQPIKCISINHYRNRLESKEHKLLFNKLFGMIEKVDLENNNDTRESKIIISNYVIK